MHDHKHTWEIYAASWKSETATGKRKLFEKSLNPDCHYHDPMIQTKGWDELENYMLDFHQQIPGGHFVTTYFLSHSDKSIARWEMHNANDVVLGEGISYCEYDSNGKLLTMTGFFEPPNTSPTDATT